MTDADFQNDLEGFVDLKEQFPEMVEVIDLQSDLLSARFQAEVPPVKVGLDAQSALKYLRQGIPLLHAQEVAWDWDAIFLLYRQICSTTARHRPDLAAEFDRLEKLADGNPSHLQDLMLSYLGGNRPHGNGNGNTPEEAGNDDRNHLLPFVFTHALQPFLKAYADALSPFVREKVWKLGTCPICAGEPDFAFLDAQTRSRYLVCSRCDTTWRFSRVMCPFCGTTDGTHLAYFLSADEAYRLYICRDCHRYIKAIDLQKARGGWSLPIERVKTTAIDLAAQEAGFH